MLIDYFLEPIARLLMLPPAIFLAIVMPRLLQDAAFRLRQPIDFFFSADTAKISFFTLYAR